MTAASARFRLAWALAGGLAVLMAAHPAARAAEPQGQPVTPACDRVCLEGFASRYMAALLVRDPSRLPWASAVRFSENNVMLRIGDGLWGTITAKSPADLVFADPDKGEVGYFGVVEQHGVPGYYAMRLKIEDGRIAEVETQVHTVAAPGSDPVAADPRAFKHYPVMGEVLPPAERTPRLRMIDIANGYFSTLQLNDGKILTAFDEDCRRLENGLATAGTPESTFHNGGLSCEQQFRLGNFLPDSAVRDRDYVVVDEERGLVLARAFIDHNGVLTDYKLTDGTPITSFSKTPSSLSMLELFKIKNGKIWRVEVVHIVVPYAMPSAWRRHSDAHQ